MEPRSGDWLKIGFERICVGSGLARLSRGLGKSRIVILAYHNIVSDASPVFGDSSLHLPESAFQEQMELLLETHEILPLGSLFQTQPKRLKKPRAVVTFDDAYSGTVSLGLEYLESKGIPATIFVIPSLVGGETFWWDALADTETGELRPERRRFFLEDLEGRQEKILAWARESGYRIQTAPPTHRSADKGQLLDALSSGLFSVGSHTWSHPNLTRIGGIARRRELSESRSWLLRHFGNWYESAIAYPYGLVSKPASQMASELYGIRLLLGGRIGKDKQWLHMDVPRINIPSGLSLRGFELRISGLKRADG